MELTEWRWPIQLGGSHLVTRMRGRVIGQNNGRQRRRERQSDALEPALFRNVSNIRTLAEVKMQRITRRSRPASPD